jgi:hypothetical protein
LVALESNRLPSDLRQGLLARPGIYCRFSRSSILFLVLIPWLLLTNEEQNDSVTIRRRADLVAVTAALLILVTTILYSWKTSRPGAQPMGLFRPFPRGETMYLREQANRPLLWVLVVLLGGIVLASYGARFASPYRRTALLLSGVVLLVMGWLAIFPYDSVHSVGVPLFVSGLLCLVAAVRRRRLTQVN